MTDALIERTERSIRKGLDWLVANDAGINKVKDFSAHYKAPYLYAVTGLRERGRKYADLLSAEYLREDGDFRMAEKVKGWEHLPSSPANRYIYGNGWTVAGLQKLGAYRAVQKGLDFLTAFQDPDLGGFYSRYDLERKTIDRTSLDTSSTCSAALALMACGQFERAVRAGEFLLRMIESQPEKKRFFFTTWEKGTGVLVDVFHDENAAAIRGRKHFCVSSEQNALHEMVWFIGMPMKILGRLYELTGKRAFLEGAGAFFTFFNRLSPERWQNNSATKVMWGAAELYRQTGRSEYRDAAARILDWLVGSQHESGVWVHSLWYRSIEEQPFQATLDLVQEYVSEFSDVIYDLCR
jgi:hypothetical protein